MKYKYISIWLLGLVCFALAGPPRTEMFKIVKLDTVMTVKPDTVKTLKVDTLLSVKMDTTFSIRFDTLKITKTIRDTLIFMKQDTARSLSKPIKLRKKY